MITLSSENEDRKRQSDAELMELVREGDFGAFDELYSRHCDRIRRFLFSLTWDQDTTEDYLQEVFLRLYRARGRYTPQGSFPAYLLRIAKNYYLAQRRKKGSKSEVSLAHQEPDGYRPYENIRASERVEPEVHLLEEYRRFKIRQAIETLPDRLKLVFVMSHIQSMKYAEIAEVLGVPLGTVKSRMFAAVRALQSLLKED